MDLSKEQLQFLELLKAGLWGTNADTTRFGCNTDWPILIELSKRQACLGVTYDGMLTLPKQLQPTRNIFLQWSHVVAKMEEANEFQYEKLCEVFTLYREHGLTPVLLKGLGVAQNYRNPHRRHSGDMDVFVGKADFLKANELLHAEATGEGGVNERHTTIHWRNSVIENHRSMLALYNPVANKFFSTQLNSWYPHKCRSLMIGEYRVDVAPLEFDIVYLLIHAIHHLLNDGMGLRQVCDWVCMLDKHKSEINKQTLLHLIKGAGLTNAAHAMEAIAVNHLGLPTENLPFVLDENDCELGEQLLHDILEGGDFGRYYKNRKPKPTTYWAGKWHTFSRIFKRCCKFKQVASAEARWYPFYLLWHFSRNTLNRGSSTF